MNHFYIARHGETNNNRDGRLSGWIDSPLTPRGLAPTATVIKKLQPITFNAIYASDLGRAFITAYYIARGLNYQSEIFRAPGLREVNYGDAANMLRDEAYKKYPGIDSNSDLVPPNGQSLHDMQSTVLTTISQIDKQYSNDNILLVCHSGTMAAINAKFRGDDFGTHNISEAYSHDFVAHFTLQNGQIASFEAVND